MTSGQRTKSSNKVTHPLKVFVNVCTARCLRSHVFSQCDKETLFFRCHLDTEIKSLPIRFDLFPTWMSTVDAHGRRLLLVVTSPVILQICLLLCVCVCAHTAAIEVEQRLVCFHTHIHVDATAGIGTFITASRRKQIKIPPPFSSH